MLKSALLRLLLGLPMLAAPAMAQGITHLNVPAKQMVRLFTSNRGPSLVWEAWIDSQDTVTYGAYWTVPAGYSLVIQDAELHLGPSNGVAVQVNGSVVGILVSSTCCSQGFAAVLPFGYVPTYGVYSSVNMNAGTRVASGSKVSVYMQYGYGATPPNSPLLYDVYLRGYLVAE